MQVKIEESWREALAPEFEKPYFASLSQRLHAEKAAGKQIYPPGGQIFKAFELCPLPEVKVVILGQDPYHGYGQAMGLSFSVPDGVPAPPSLKNIFKEIEDDLGVKMSGRPNLEKWARQGVLLLNASEKREGVVFMLWGNYARSKAPLIDPYRHTILQAAHPSPLARGAFFGCRHFSQANAILRSEGLEPIDWQL